MRTGVTEVDDRLRVVWVPKIMRKFGATSRIVTRRDENDEDGMLLLSAVAMEVMARKVPSSNNLLCARILRISSDGL
jgi:hypothetical protein